MLDADVLLVDRFCEKFDLCWAIQTSDITPVVSGLYGTIYVFDESLGKLSLEFCPDELPDGWAATMRKLRQAKFDTVRDCSCGSCAAFNPDDPQQSKLALEIVGVTPVADSSAQRQRMRDVITAARSRMCKQTAAKLNTRQRKLAKQGILVDLDELEVALHGASSKYVCSLKF